VTGVDLDAVEKIQEIIVSGVKQIKDGRKVITRAAANE